MLRKNFKGLIIGVIIGIIFSNALVFAEPIYKTVEIVYNGIKINIDGNEITPKDANGNVVEPFNYNGTVYLPVRAMGEALGKDVSYNADTQTVFLKQKTNNTATPNIWLDEMDYFNFQKGTSTSEFKIWDENKNKDSAGNTHKHGIWYHLYGHGDEIQGHAIENWLYVDYLLNSKYTRFKGNFSIAYESRSTKTAMIKLIILGDDKVLYQVTTKAGDIPINFDVNITGVNKLTIRLEHTPDYYQGSDYLCITDAGFYE